MICRTAFRVGLLNLLSNLQLQLSSVLHILISLVPPRLIDFMYETNFKLIFIQGKQSLDDLKLLKELHFNNFLMLIKSSILNKQTDRQH